MDTQGETVDTEGETTSFATALPPTGEPEPEDLGEGGEEA
jgi:hypothetical protein